MCHFPNKANESENLMTNGMKSNKHDKKKKQSRQIKHQKINEEKKFTVPYKNTHYLRDLFAISYDPVRQPSILQISFTCTIRAELSGKILQEV